MTSTDALDTDQLRTLVPFAAVLDVRLSHAGPEEVCLQMDWRPGLRTAAGVMHGGALMSLADTAGAVALSGSPTGAAGRRGIRSDRRAPRRAPAWQAASVAP